MNLITERKKFRRNNSFYLSSDTKDNGTINENFDQN